MPGTTTHNYILYKSLTTLGGPPPGKKDKKAPPPTLLEEVIASNNAVRGYVQKNNPAGYRADAKCLLAGCAYMGCFGPDLFYLEFGTRGKFIADLHHYNCSSLFMIWCLRQLKRKGINKYTNFLKRQFAYVLGHISHIAADINVHPYVNSIVAAYPDNKEIFKNARGLYAGKIWKFHNILEHYQDTYVLHKKFQAKEKFGTDWENVNVARAAAEHFFKSVNKSERFLVDICKKYYRFTKVYEDSLEQDKYNFFKSTNWIIDINSYYKTTIPNEKTMDACKRMVQPALLDKYIDEAVSNTHDFWTEAENYMNSKENDDLGDDDLSKAKKHFPKLRKHWNLDCGLAPEAQAVNRQWDLPGAERIHIAGNLTFKSVHSKEWKDAKY